MKCNKLVDIGRRRFLQGGAVAAAGVATLSVSHTPAKAAPATARVEYPSNRLANIGILRWMSLWTSPTPTTTAPACC